MGQDQSGAVNHSDSNCAFCRITNGTDPDGAATEILCQDEELVCFRDIEPAAPHHYLVVPRRHIKDVTQLSAEHAPLVVRMANMGLTALRANHFNDVNESRLGFHVPPSISVPHLHLHVLAPRSLLYQDALQRCLTPCDAFLTVEHLLRRLSPKDVLWPPDNALSLNP